MIMLLRTLPQREPLTAGWATSKCRLKPGAGQGEKNHRNRLPNSCHSSKLTSRKITITDKNVKR